MTELTPEAIHAGAEHVSELVARVGKAADAPAAGGDAPIVQGDLFGALTGALTRLA